MYIAIVYKEISTATTFARATSITENKVYANVQKLLQGNIDKHLDILM